METISVAIVSSDMEYAKALGAGMINVYRDFAIRIADSRDFVKEWVEYKGKEVYYKKYDVVLWADREAGSVYGDNIVWMTDKISETRKDRRNRKFAIYKYSSAQATVAAVFDIYMMLTGRRAVNIRKDSIGIYGFSSWQGGCGCTTAALAFAQEMQRFRGKKVMYISLETIESTGLYFPEVEGCRTTAEYLYRLLKEKDNGILPAEKGNEIPFLDSYIVRDLYGVEAFAPARGMNPLPGLKEKDMQCLIASIADSGRYDVLTIDLGTCVTEAALAAGRLAEKIICVTEEKDVTAREGQYMNHVMCMTHDGSNDKMIRVVNKCNEKDEKENLYISRNLSIVKGEIKEVLLDGEFGNDIRKLADVITKPAAM
ncbi:MAG: hypothetical protein PUB75_05680 [Firmicutes bacterium]|nr:hypothetical protein [Bacillota bacterium]